MAEINKLKIATMPADLLGAEADMVCGPDGCMLPDPLTAPISREAKAGTSKLPGVDEKAIPAQKA